MNNKIRYIKKISLLCFDLKIKKSGLIIFLLTLIFKENFFKVLFKKLVN